MAEELMSIGETSSSQLPPDISSEGRRDTGDQTAELFFLIAHFLKHASPCTKSAELLQKELRERKLLGDAYDWNGNARPASFDDLQRRHRSLPGDQLSRLLHKSLQGNGAGSTSGRGPASARSLLSRLAPFGEDRQYAQRAQGQLAKRVIDVCLQLLRTEKQIREVWSELTSLELKLDAQGSGDIEGVGGAAEGLESCGMVGKANPGGQERQAELTSLAIPRKVEELKSQLSALRSEAASTRALKEVVVTDARQGGALRSSLSRYKCKSLFTAVFNRQGAGGCFRFPPSEGGCSARLGLAAISLPPRRMHPLSSVNGHGLFPVYCVKFDRTGQYAFTGADDCLIKVWSVRSTRLLLTLRGHSSVITDLAVSPDNSMLASASNDKIMRVWDPRTGENLAVLRGHASGINIVEFGPLENILVSTSEDGTCRVWDLRDRYSLASDDVLPVVLPHTNFQGEPVPTTCISMSPAGELFALGCQDGQVRVWSYRDRSADGEGGDKRHSRRSDRLQGGEVYTRATP
ncbi:unnamed protein product, partial [Discosporangium mesarthrocarpum]